MAKIIYRSLNSPAVNKLESLNNLLEANDWDNIVWLLISNIQFTEKFVFPPKLTELYICKCLGSDLLAQLPSTIRFVEIKESWLSDPSGLFSPDQTLIETVNLSYNQIVNFPTNLPEKLVSIDLSNNIITKLPDSNCIPSGLRQINLSFNNLLDLPEWLLDLNSEINLTLMPNKFWFNAYSNISLNKTIHDYHIEIANRFFSSALGAKLIQTRLVGNNQAFRVNDPADFPINLNRNLNYNYNLAPINHNPRPILARTTADQAQNVHNSDIQESFSKSVEKIMNNPAPSIPNFISKMSWYYIFDGFNLIANSLFVSLVKSNCEITAVVSRNGVTWAEIFERIWAISEIHEYKNEIRRVLRDEINAGARVCFTGKITRLVNSLSGFIDDVQIGISENEQINNAIIACMRRCEANPQLNLKAEAKKALDELNVPEERQSIWLDALE